MADKSKKGLIVFICLIVVTVAVSIGSVFIKGPSTPGNTISFHVTKHGGNKSSVKLSRKHKNAKNTVGIIHVVGTISEANSTYNQKWILDTISQLKESENNVALVLCINSPGGAVYETDEVYLALQDYKTTGRPVYAYMENMAASGGYYMACAADKIYANRNTITGSIGVIAGQFIDLTDLFADYGIKYETIHAGRNKNMGNYNEAITDEQRQIMQDMADECYEQFTKIVAKGRNLPLERVQELADGRIYTAKQALINDLIDNINTFENMMKDLEREFRKTELTPIHFKYERKMTFMESMMSMKSRLSGNTAMDIPTKLLAEIESFNEYPAYLYR